MKWLSMSVVCALMLSSSVVAEDLPAQSAPGQPVPGESAPADQGPFKTLKENASYAFGLQIGTSIRGEELDVDAKLLAQGLTDALSEGKPQMTEDQVRAAITAFQRQALAAAEAKAREAATKNQAEGEKFLAANGKKEGVVTTKSGLQYKVVKSGTGQTPKATDVVQAHYRGTLLDGTEFDSSYKRGKPSEFPVGRVIPGWTEALQLMKVGDKWVLYIPADLAYGEGGQGPIPPNSTLVFDIELVGIK